MTDPDDATGLSEADQETNSINRRSFVRAFGAAGAIGAVGLTSAGRASAEERNRKAEQAKQPYTTPRAVQKAVEVHGSDTLSKLVDQGLIESPTVSEFTTDQLSDAKEYAEASEGTYVGAVEEDGDYAAHIVIRKQTATAEVELFVQPQFDRSYTFIKSKSETEDLQSTASSDADVTSGSVTPQSCSRVNGCVCGPAYCPTGGSEEYYKLYCSGSGRYKKGAPTGCCCYPRFDCECA